jgi:hypothetical protein
MIGASSVKSAISVIGTGQPNLLFPSCPGRPMRLELSELALSTYCVEKLRSRVLLENAKALESL